MRYVWAHMSHIKMKRLIYAVEAGFLAWILAIFFEVMTPLLKAVVSWWIHCCVFLFALVIMQDFPTLWALGCSLSADSCARALGPSDKLVGYWSNSSSSSDIAIPFFSFTVLFLQCYLLFFVLLCDLLLRCCTRILSGILTWVPSSLYVIVWSSSCYLLLLSSFLCFLCDLLLRCCTRILSGILTWVPFLGVLLFWSRPASSFVFLSS